MVCAVEMGAVGTNSHSGLALLLMASEYIGCLALEDLEVFSVLVAGMPTFEDCASTW